MALEKEENAMIHRADIYIEDHGILTAFLDLEFDGSAQGFGGYGFDWVPKKERRYSQNCALFIRRVLDTVGKRSWDKLPGTAVRVKREDGWGSRIVAIGHITKNQWFNPQEEFEAAKKWEAE